MLVNLVGLNSLLLSFGDNILSENEATKFYHGYWNDAIRIISEGELKKYLTERYV